MKMINKIGENINEIKDWIKERGRQDRKDE